MFKVRYAQWPGPHWIATCRWNGTLYWTASVDGPYQALLGVCLFIRLPPYVAD